MVDLSIRHVLACVRHPQTNGKMEWFGLEMEWHLKFFEDESVSNTVRNVKPDDYIGSPFHTAKMADPAAWPVDWYNNLPHISLMGGKETPEAHMRKQAPKDVTSEEMGEDSHAKV